MVRLKGFLSVLSKLDKTEFQFLMVRLKVVLAFKDGRQNWISIPYGAIKSKLKIGIY